MIEVIYIYPFFKNSIKLESLIEIFENKGFSVSRNRLFTQNVEYDNN